MDVLRDGTDVPNSDTPPPVTLAQATLYWLKLGFMSFGGPAGQIAIMHHDLVEKKRWISESRFLHALNYCMVLPGPEAQQLATYIGWLMHRTAGGLIAGTFFVLPSFFILVGLAWVYMAYGSVPAIAGMLYGFKPAVVAIVLFAAYRIGSRILKNAITWSIAALAFLAVLFSNYLFPLSCWPQVWSAIQADASRQVISSRQIGMAMPEKNLEARGSTIIRLRLSMPCSAGPSLFAWLPQGLPFG